MSVEAVGPRGFGLERYVFSCAKVYRESVHCCEWNERGNSLALHVPNRAAALPLNGWRYQTLVSVADEFADHSDDSFRRCYARA
jgi:hypothetical protein